MSIVSPPAINYEELVAEDDDGFRINGRLYQDLAIFQDEMDKIFHRGWVFIAHESEVGEPGDYITRLIGLQPIIISRDENLQIHVLMNRCRHRSATVCQEESGNSFYFRCAYHGWSYANTGRNVGATFQGGRGGYDPTNFREEDWSLMKVPRVVVHRGFIFASLSPTDQSFDEYIGGAKDYIDRFCDMAPEGEIIARAGRQRVLVHANWKLQLENLTDGYHAPFTHQTALGAARPFRQVAPMQQEDDNKVQRDLGGGHTILDNFRAYRGMDDSVRATSATGTLDPRVIEGVAKRLGREKAEWLAKGGPPHIMVFPNLMILHDAYRMIQPVSVNRTHLYYYPTALKGAPDDVNFARLRSLQSGFGPAGFISPDDMDMFTRIQLGTRAKVYDWSVLNRGRHSEAMELDDFGRPALTTQYTAEVGQRGVWRHYKHVMAEA